MVDRNRKGKDWERDVANYLSAVLDLKVRRAVAGRDDDVGDLFGIPHHLVQCKNYRDTLTAIRDACDGVVEQLERDPNKVIGWGVVKRRNAPVGDAYAVMPLWMAAATMKAFIKVSGPEELRRLGVLDSELVAESTDSSTADDLK